MYDGVKAGGHLSGRRDAVRNRAAIVTAATDAWLKDPDVSVDVIAAHAGLSRKSVYRHFGTRKSLVEGVTRALVRKSMENLAGVEALERGVDVQLAVSAARLWDGLGSARRLASCRLNGAARAFATAQAAPLRRLLADLIERGQAEGTVRTDLTAVTVQHLVEAHAGSLLEAAAESPLSSTDTRMLFIVSMLGDIGLSASQSQAVIEDNEDLLGGRPLVSAAEKRGL